MKVIDCNASVRPCYESSQKQLGHDGSSKLYDYLIVYFDTSAKVLILAWVSGLSPERSEGDNHTSVESSFTRVSNDIFRYRRRKSDFLNLQNV